MNLGLNEKINTFIENENLEQKLKMKEEDSKEKKKQKWEMYNKKRKLIKTWLYERKNIETHVRLIFLLLNSFRTR